MEFGHAMESWHVALYAPSCVGSRTFFSERKPACGRCPHHFEKPVIFSTPPIDQSSQIDPRSVESHSEVGLDLSSGLKQRYASLEGLPNRMASISEVVAVYHRWYLFQVVIWLGANLGLAGWMVGRQPNVRRPAAIGSQRQSVVGGWGSARTANSGRRTAVGGRLTGGGPILFGNLSYPCIVAIGFGSKSCLGNPQ